MSNLESSVTCDEENVIANNVSTESISKRQWEEVEIEMSWGRVCGKWYGNRGEQPILAIHGWLDNAGSFDRLIPLLPPTMPVFSIDLPGHGHSSHFPMGMHYHIYWDYIPVIRRIVKHFGWRNLKLLGHSMGGGVCFMYAASYPKDVEQIICLDSYGPVVRNPRTDASITGTVIDKVLSIEALSSVSPPQYTLEDVIKRRQDEGSIDREATKILLKRSLKAEPGCVGEPKYKILTDSRLKFCGLGLFTLEQLLTYASMIQCPVLNIKAVPGLKFDKPEIYQKVLGVLRNNVDVEYHEIGGSHYLHLEEPEKIAEIVKMFLLNVNQF